MRSLRTWLGSLMFIALSFTLVGCGPGTTKVNGKVTLDGQPVAGATVTFVGDGHSGTGTAFTKPDGTFEMVSPVDANAGILNGKYKVLITKIDSKNADKIADPTSKDAIKQMMAAAKGGSAAPKNQLPTQYASPDKTPLTVEVPPASMPLELKLTK
ncbi:transthyretin-like family protein [Tuwongella immobilis]|uniref:Carboxypeptidase regulatory-like domain-containing protein n=1 Tax=Tuwongella immobilis TaxID=692036 RepID=A0A6C2YPM4_9BACT|nr:carboxypeptidase-like regulatory domain-containing protein [Tuwongella immobilis]VIP03578.1 Uncharacterized protein OS=Pirellula staleyi (strain ATCC 27377 / DSM 6068 / ICPB 4128) GN=Psta_0189 PE=4 SV=1 [Tuwongella immobilis]VTS04524.1 Uncharacterized protein OS=Pirellula staleyi (strain ATCC 27377 / DSM 6068 / ICPB 4128) GN=Psta_0189 PE=4 SV=1 [Tuwongella immobilis]